MKRRLRKKILKLLLKLLRESLETLSLLGWKVGEEVLTSGQQGLVHVPSHPGIADATVVQVVASGVHAIVITAEVDNSTRSQEVNLVGQH